jgi:zinc protease
MATLIKKHCEPWNAKTKKTTVFGPVLTSLQNTIVRIIDKPDLSQTSIILGHPIPGELDAARSMMALANYVLGGGNFSSRLMAHIRSTAGKTYGISSQISCNRDFGVLSIATSTQNSQVEEMLSSIMKVYGEFAEKGIVEEELQKAKQFAVGNMAFQLEGIVNVADKLLWLKQFNRDVSYIERFDEMINAITLESVNDVIKKYFTPGKFAIVAVGKKEEITDILKKYGSVQTLGFRADPV